MEHKERSEIFSRWSAGLRFWDMKMLVLLVIVFRPVFGATQRPVQWIRNGSCHRISHSTWKNMQDERFSLRWVWGSTPVVCVMCTEVFGGVCCLYHQWGIASHRKGFFFTVTYLRLHHMYETPSTCTSLSHWPRNGFCELKPPPPPPSRYVYIAQTFQMKSCNARNIFILLKTRN